MGITSGQKRKLPGSVIKLYYQAIPFSYRYEKTYRHTLRELLVNEAREKMIEKLNRILKTDIRPLIECEMILDPRVVEARTSSAFGAIYGNASNNKFAAFMRHPNFSKEIF